MGCQSCKEWWQWQALYWAATEGSKPGLTLVGGAPVGSAVARGLRSYTICSCRCPYGNNLRGAGCTPLPFVGRGDRPAPTAVRGQCSCVWAGLAT